MNNRRQNAAKLQGAESVSRRFANGLMLTLTLVIVFSLGASVALAQVPVINTPLVPGQKAPGAGQFTLTVNGTGFASDAVVNWNGKALTTTFVTAEKLTATVPSSDLTKAGTAAVTVVNGTGVASNVATFQIIKNGYTVAWATQEYGTDTSPQDVTTAQFTSSGQLDLAVATGNNTVSILLGNGSGTFPTHVQYAVPGNPVAIGHGDFNGDGKQDIATADQYGSEISVLLGNGDGTFQTHQEYATGTEPLGLAIADVSGDGKLDIVTVNYRTNNVSVLLGNGDGTFKTHVDYATGNGPSGVAIGDFNGDGKLDIVAVNNTDGTVSILLGNGDGTFQTAIPYNTAINPNSVVVGDFNGDGILDLAVGTSNKSISVLLGNANGTFQNHKEYTIGANAVAVAAADLASTGKLSLISANSTDNTVSVLVGNGDGTFKSESVFPTNALPSGIAVGDFNDDGKLDIAVSATTGNTASVLLDSQIVLSPTLLPFATQTSGDPSAAKTITIKNNSTTSYTFGTPSCVGAYCTDFTETTTCGASLAAGATCTYSVVFDPTASETANAQYLLTTSGGSVLGFQMTGTGNVPILMNPRTITFPGYQLIGTTSAAKVTTFTNKSGVPITFTSLVLTGANPTEFSETTTCPGLLGNPPGTLGAGASCTSNIYYTPTQSGGANVTQIYSGNFTVGEAGSLISGKGTAVKVTPTTYTFPNTKVGSTSTTTVSFENAGSTPLSISSVGWTGTEPYFSQTNTCNYPGGSVPANSTCTFTVTFAPLTTGTFTATMSIGDSDPTGPQQVAFTGTGD